MAMLLFEKGQGRGRHRAGDPSGNRRRPGTDQRAHDAPREASDVALLLRAGALAAPMEIIEERTVGPSLGAREHRARFPLHRGSGSRRSPFS